MNVPPDIPAAVRIGTGRGGLPRIHISTDLAEADIYPHGAHVTHFQPRGQQPVLFLSDKSRFQPGKAIRGGVPICFPWFGPAQKPDLPQHGLARLLDWELKRITEVNSVVLVELDLNSSKATRLFWKRQFHASYTVTVGRSLGLAFSVANADPATLSFEAALHTYLHVGDVRSVTLHGLQRSGYNDKVQQGAAMPPTGEALRFTGETDRVYQPTRDTCVIDDPTLKRKLIVEKLGSLCTVVWNPWIEKAKAMPDFGDDEWPQLLCVETANLGEHSVALEPGATHTISAEVRIE